MKHLQKYGCKPKAPLSEGRGASTGTRRCLARIWSLVLVCLLTLQLAIPAQAAQRFVYIQTTIDLSTWEILGNVVSVEVGSLSASLEARRIDKETREALAAGSSSLVAGTNLLNTRIPTYAGAYDAGMMTAGGSEVGIPAVFGAGISGIFSETNNPLSFPGAQKGKDATTADMEQAHLVMSSLIHDLNGAFAAWMEAKDYERSPSVVDFQTKMVEFLTEMNGRAAASGDPDRLTLSDDNPAKYRWRIAKGYVGAGRNPSLENLAADQDAEYVNWATLVYEAFHNFLLSGDEAVRPDNVYAQESGNLGEQFVVGIFSALFLGLRSLLGLWSLDELIFNEGHRAFAYVGGVFPAQWEGAVWAIFLFMEILAGLVLLYGLVTTVLRKAVSTANPVERGKAMEQVQNIIVCAIALALLPILLRIVLQLSASLTEVFRSIAPEDKSVGQMLWHFSASSGALSGVIAQFMGFGAQIYFNAFYALRSISTGLLIMIAPVMISMMLTGDARKGIAMQWAKELLAGICIQPIHALCTAVILNAPTSSHAFDNLIAVYAIIPISSMIRGLLFGNATGWMDAAAKAAKGKVTTPLAAAGMAATGAAVMGAGSAFAGAFAGEFGEKTNDGQAESGAAPDSPSGEDGGQAPSPSESDGGSSGGGSGGKPSFGRKAKAALSGTVAGAKAVWENKGSIARGTALACAGGLLSGLGAGGMAGYSIASTGQRIASKKKNQEEQGDRTRPVDQAPVEAQVPSEEGEGQSNAAENLNFGDGFRPEVLMGPEGADSSGSGAAETVNGQSAAPVSPGGEGSQVDGGSHPGGGGQSQPQKDGASQPLPPISPQQRSEISNRLKEQARTQAPVPLPEFGAASALRSQAEYQQAKTVMGAQELAREDRSQAREEAEYSGGAYQPYRLAKHPEKKGMDGTPLTQGAYLQDGGVRLEGKSLGENGIRRAELNPASEDSAETVTLTFDAAAGSGLAPADYQNLRLMEAVYREGGAGREALAETGIQNIHYDSGKGSYSMQIDPKLYEQNYQTKVSSVMKDGWKHPATTVTIPDGGAIVPDVSGPVAEIVSRDHGSVTASEQAVQQQAEQWLRRYAGAEATPSPDGGVQHISYPCPDRETFQVMAEEVQATHPNVSVAFGNHPKTGESCARVLMPDGTPLVSPTKPNYGPTVQAILDQAGQASPAQPSEQAN